MHAVFVIAAIVAVIAIVSVFHVHHALPMAVIHHAFAVHHHLRQVLFHDFLLICAKFFHSGSHEVQPGILERCFFGRNLFVEFFGLFEILCFDGGVQVDFQVFNLGFQAVFSFLESGS